MNNIADLQKALQKGVKVHITNQFWGDKRPELTRDSEVLDVYSNGVFFKHPTGVSNLVLSSNPYGSPFEFPQESDFERIDGTTCNIYGWMGTEQLNTRQRMLLLTIKLL